MVSAVPQTTNFAFNLPPFDFRLYHDLVNDNFQVIDAILNQYLAVQNVVGVWQNSTAYTVGQRVIDDIVGTIYNCNIAHTSAAVPTTFAQDRATNPTYWSSLSQAASAKGAWVSGTQYQTNDFVSSGNIFAVALDAHVAGSTFAGDSVHWAYLIDLSSFTIPSGVGHSLQYLRQNVTETGQEYVSPATVLTAINNTAILAQVQSANIFLAAQTIQSATTLGILTIICTDPANTGPVPDLYHNSVSPAAADTWGWWFSANSSTAVKRQYAKMLIQLVDPTNGAESGRIDFQTIRAGTSANRFTIAAGIFTTNAVGTDQGVDTVNAKAYYIDGVAVAGRDNVNPIVNPDAAVVQLGASIAAGSMNDNVYGSDGTRILLEANGDCAWSQDASTFNATGFAFCDKLLISVNNKKFGLFKPIENKDLGFLSINGTTVIASAYIAASASIGNVKMGILAWTSTADAITGDPISAWGADGVTPTLAANWAFCNTPANLSVTGSVTRFSVTGTIPAGTTNLALFIWNDDKVTTAADSLLVSGYDLRRGNILLPYEPINFQSNLARCQRYFFKTFLQATAPATAAGRAGAHVALVTTAAAVAGNFGVRLPVVMRTAPTLTVYNPDAANNQVRNYTKTTDSTGATSGNIGDIGLELNYTGAAGWAVNDILGVHYTLAARL